MEKFSLDPEIAELIRAPKAVEGDRLRFQAPKPGGKLSVRLITPSNSAWKFYLDISEGSRVSSVAINLREPNRKITMQTRYYASPLVRIDLTDTGIHTNPDGTRIVGSHVHFATKRYADRIAFPLAEQDIIPDLARCTSIPDTFEALRAFCSIDRNIYIEWLQGA